MFVPGSIPNIIFSFIIIFQKNTQRYVSFSKNDYLCRRIFEKGALAHLARALDWQSKGDGFDPRMLHKQH